MGAEVPLKIFGISGELCQLSLKPGCCIRDLKKAVAELLKADPVQLRLLYQLREVQDEEELPPSSGKSLEFTLVKRPEEQARWINEMREGIVAKLKADAGSAKKCGSGMLRPTSALIRRWSVRRLRYQETERVEGQSLEYADAALRADKAMALLAVQSDWRALQFADEALRDDKQVVLTAVKQDWCALQFASDALRCDREICLAAISQAWAAILFMDPSLRADRTFLMSALQTDQCRLGIAAGNLRDDKEVVLMAVERHGLSLAD
ncbi:unnamed protein product, partial [Symbiodinium pilosum]